MNHSLGDIFRLAANREDGYVRGKAVAAFQVHGHQYDDICSQSFEFYQDIPIRYLATLLTGNHRYEIKYRGSPTYTQLGWAGIADRFYKLKEGGSNLAAGLGS
jgi:hypothetical protein